MQIARRVVEIGIVQLAGNVSESSQARLYEDHRERITVLVEGADPLYSELRVRNDRGWTVGQKVMVIIAPANSAEK